jgi:phage baseplate assembly protein W
MAVQQQKKIYRGFSSQNPFGGFKLYDEKLVIQDLLNQLRVRKGERVMNPEFGTIIWHAVFEPLTSELKNSLVEDLQNIIDSDPRLRLDKINVVEYGMGLQFEIDLTYVEFNMSGSITLNFDQTGQLTLV